MESLLHSSGWGGEGMGHACALLPPPARFSHPPTLGCFKRIWNGAINCLLPCSWHFASKLYLRSQKALLLEKQRQLSSRCWFVVHPYSPFKFYWDCVNMIFFFINCFYMPLQVFFTCPNPYDPFILMNDGLAFLSIIIHFCTGRVDADNKKVILNLGHIAKRYLRESFICELIAALPFQCLQLYEDCTLPSHTAFYSFKFLRVFAIHKVTKNVFSQFGCSYLVAVLITVILRGLFFFHWMTYAHYQIPVLYAHLGDKESNSMQKWLLRVKALPVDGSPLVKYTHNIYYVSGFCIGASVYSSLKQEYLFIGEQILISVMSLIGFLFTAYAATTILRLVVYRHFESYLHNGRLKELQDYLEFRRLPERLKRKVQLYINYRFNGHYFDENFILSTINVQIKQEINMFCCKKLVINVPLFQNMPIAVINTIIFSLNQVLYMPGEVIVQYGQPGNSIYLIASGTVAIMNAENREVGHLKDGAFFGERSLLKPGTPRNATIVALEITEIYKLNHQQLQACLQPVARAPRRSTAPPGPPAEPPPPRRDTIHSLSARRDTSYEYETQERAFGSFPTSYTDYYYQ